MKKAIVVILMLGLIITLIGNSVGMGQKTLRTPQTNVSTTTIVDTEQELEEYVPKIIIEAKWGTKPGEFGILKYKYRSVGPSAIAINEEGDIFVADPVNYRIQVFNRNGEFKKEIKLIINLLEEEKPNTRIDLAVDKKNNVFCEWGIIKNGCFIEDRIQKYSFDGKLLKEWDAQREIYPKRKIPLSESVFKVTPWGEVYLLGIYNEKTYRIISFEDCNIVNWGEGSVGLDGYRFKDFVGDMPKDTLTVIDKQGNKKELSIPLIDKFVRKKEEYKKYTLWEIKYLNMDRAGYLYTISNYSTYTLGKITKIYKETKIVTKSTLAGKVISQIEFSPDYLEGLDIFIIIVDFKGNIYEIKCRKESGVKIIRWEINKK